MLFLRSWPSIAALISSIIFRVIQCAPATTPLPMHPIYSLPPLQPSLPLNASSNGNGNNGNCASVAKYPNWSSNDWVIEDCFAAVQQVYLKEVRTHPDEAYEFVAPGVSPTRSPPDSQRTPRKYIVSELARRLTCCWRLRKTLMVYRKLCPNNHAAGLVPARAIARGHKI